MDCLPQVPKTFSNDGKTFILIVELTEPNRRAVELLSQNIETLENDVLSKNSKWFRNELLILMNGLIFDK